MAKIKKWQVVIFTVLVFQTHYILNFLKPFNIVVSTHETALNKFYDEINSNSFQKVMKNPIFLKALESKYLGVNTMESRRYVGRTTFVSPRRKKTARRQNKTISSVRDFRNVSTKIPQDLPPSFIACLNQTCNDIDEMLNSSQSLRYSGKKLCPCIPSTLVGKTTMQFVAKPMLELAAKYADVEIGGHWSPPHCVARQRIAIIIPYRNRDEHLKIFLDHIIPVLQRQLADFRIFVVEQEYPEQFNKAATMNAGFLEIQKLWTFDCVIFHDVDLIPETDYIPYICRRQMPIHIGGIVNNLDYNYALTGIRIAGGVVAFTPAQFIKVNGYSNQYWGWGGEDDDLYYRIVSRHMKIFRYHRNIARYTMLSHKRDRDNQQKNRRGMLTTLLTSHDYEKDGLNSINYVCTSIEPMDLVTWILVVIA